MSKIIGVTVGTTQNPEKIAGVVDQAYNPDSPNAQSGKAVWEATSAIIRNYQQLSKEGLAQITYDELWRRAKIYGGLTFHTRGSAFTGAETELNLPAGAYVVYYNESYDTAGCWHLGSGVLYELHAFDLFDNGEYMYYVTSPFVELQSAVGNIDAALDELHNYAQALISGGAEE